MLCEQRCRGVLLPAKAAPCCSGDGLSLPTAAALWVPIACCSAPAAPVASVLITSVVSHLLLLKWLNCFTQ